jgi:ssDNA-binding Zn-finger/Zn-ribbon topoisomerase 1
MAGAVWVLENDDDEEDDRVPYLSAADLGIVKCPECGGTWKIDDNCGALYRCPRCHDHGWLRVQPANLEQANGTQEVSDE